MRVIAGLVTAAAIAAVVAVAIRPGAGPAVRVQPVAGRTVLPSGRLVPAHGAYFGAYVKPLTGASYVAVERAITTLEHKIGRKLAIDQLYVPWAHKMPLTIASWDLAHGRIPMLSWAGYRTNLINKGRFDAQIRAKARHIAALHGPVMLRWFPEMDGLQYRRLVPSPASFVRAWRRMHRIFARAGAKNVTWIWCPNAGHIADGVAQQFYPGARYVDWVCADGYNWAPAKRGAPWKTFAQIFSAFYQWGLTTRKPLMIGEFGALEWRRGQKGAWIRQADFQLRTMFPAIRGVIYFNAKHKGFNWRVTTSPSALAGFRAFGHDRHFGVTPRI